MELQTFTDFDEFRSTNAQLDGQWLLNGGKDWRWNTESAVVGDCQILRCFSQSGLICEGVASVEAFHFYVPFKTGVWRNNGAEFREDEVLIMEPGAEYCNTCTTPAGWHGFLVPEHSLAIDPEARGQRARLSYTVKTQPERTDAVRSLFERFMAAAAKHPNLEFSPGARMVEAELQSLLEPLLGCDDAPHTAPGRPPSREKRLCSGRLWSWKKSETSLSTFRSCLPEQVLPNERCERRSTTTTKSDPVGISTCDNFTKLAVTCSSPILKRRRSLRSWFGGVCGSSVVLQEDTAGTLASCQVRLFVDVPWLHFASRSFGDALAHRRQAPGCQVSRIASHLFANGKDAFLPELHRHGDPGARLSHGPGTHVPDNAGARRNGRFGLNRKGAPR